MTMYGTPLDEVRANALYAAKQRLNRYDLEFPPESILRPTMDMATAVLESEPPPDRAVEFFVESVAVAATMRYLYGEAPLTYEDLIQGLSVFRWFFNSFFHA